MSTTLLPYGTWPSPIAAERVARGAVTYAEPRADGDDVYWIELRPAEKGRQVIVQRAPDGRTTDRTPPGFSARTRVHEYGGGAYCVAGGTVWFSNDADGRLYRQAPGGAPVAITPAARLRFADAVLDAGRARLIAVREDHTGPGEAVNTLVAVRADGDAEGGRVLVAGADFYANPRLSPDGRQLAWLAWNHPNMPWDGCALWVAGLGDDGALRDPQRVAGGERESIFQPEWSPDGTLHFVSDRTGWWNLYRWRGGAAEALCPMAAEFGAPMWQFGASTYAFTADGRLLCSRIENGMGRLAALATGALRDLGGAYSVFQNVRASAGRAVLLAGSATQPMGVVAIDPATGAAERLAGGEADPALAGYFSAPEAIAFPGHAGRTAHALYYPPRNAACAAPKGDRPPLIVRSHGGPTSAASPAYSLGIQYFTSRGYAFADVNYGGSTGYGREYRERLNGQWGIVDVDDCIGAARYLVGRGDADGRRLAIEGGSAGGYTTLAALAFRDAFQAGASLFGLSELEIFARETHKYESRYLERLIGPYPARRDLYVARSPLHHIQNVKAPVIFFQGDEDAIVPPNQAQLMFEAVRAREIPTAYLLYPGEQHGFRKAEHIQRTLEARLTFYGRVFGAPPADALPPLEIENL